MKEGNSSPSTTILIPLKLDKFIDEYSINRIREQSKTTTDKIGRDMMSLNNCIKSSVAQDLSIGFVFVYSQSLQGDLRLSGSPPSQGAGGGKQPATQEGQYRS
ncbi:hypothetical protein PoB_001358800 [Plakobranchus ocellatus]|uniref:Uncharacterized protein n=1 Tax=Plakobranchus ocellatus TaxID=259542 RepID=A0AAV3YXX5_9GAST|nr:hypothetical protein PoB_001358800 [Plakobranchus ocellatus]